MPTFTIRVTEEIAQCDCVDVTVEAADLAEAGKLAMAKVDGSRQTIDGLAVELSAGEFQTLCPAENDPYAWRRYATTINPQGDDGELLVAPDTALGTLPQDDARPALKRVADLEAALLTALKALKHAVHWHDQLSPRDDVPMLARAAAACEEAFKPTGVEP
jgi:hypothetical protein